MNLFLEIYGAILWNKKGGMAMHVNEKRLQERIETFSKFGKTIHGGVSRLTLNEADIEGRKELVRQFKSLGLQVSYDDLGNLYGYQQGTEEGLPIVIGSHGDSVEKGGNYDGILGILCAIEAMQLLQEEKIQLTHPIVLVDFTNEEGVRFEPAMFSSGTLAGVYDEDVIFATKDRDGITFLEALLHSGFSGNKKHRLQEGAAYLELHVEQGPKLDQNNIQMGIVQGIVGMTCLDITISGESNHAGSTPMYLRKDPLLCASRCIVAMEEALLQLDKELVFTIGHFSVEPDLHTVIPSDVHFSLDIRHQDMEIIAKAKEIVVSIVTKYTQQNGCQYTVKTAWERDTVHFDPTIQKAFLQGSQELELSTMQLYSGAGHDAQFLAQMMPTGMLFVPSVGGKSHCEEEYTDSKDCANGAAVLAKAIVILDQQLGKRGTIL